MRSNDDGARRGNRPCARRRSLARVSVERHIFPLPTPCIASALQVVDMAVLGGWVEAFWMDAHGRAYALAKFGDA